MYDSIVSDSAADRPPIRAKIWANSWEGKVERVAEHKPKR